MTKYRFELEMKRLVDVFGVKSYPPERMKALWEIIKDSSDDRFEKWVNLQISDSKFAPLGENFREFAEQDRKILSFFKGTEENQSKCNTCKDGAGFVVVTNKTNNCVYAFACDCELAPTGIPKWRYANQSEYKA